MEHLFISYSRKDSEFVADVVRRLRNADMAVWQDVSGAAEGIPYSAKWFAAIEEAMYTSAGAVIFRSESWEQSGPCAKEAGLIDSLAIPVYEINLKELYQQFDQNPSDELRIQAIQNAVSEIQFWAEEVVYHNVSNLDRCWMLSAVNTRRNQHPLHGGIPRYRRRKTGNAFLKRLEQCRSLVDTLGFQEKNPGLYEELLTFLNDAKRITLRDRRFRIAAWSGFVALIVIFIIANESYRQERDNTRAKLDLLTEAKSVREISETDEVQALFKLADVSTEDYKENVSLLFENYADLLAKEYPYDFYHSGSKEAEAIIQMSSQREKEGWTFDLSETRGTIRITQADTGAGYSTTKTFGVGSVPNVYAVSGDYLAVATAQQVYVYDLLHGTRPVELQQCYRKIAALRFDDNGHIYGITHAMDVYVWENPLSRISIPETESIPSKAEESDSDNLFEVVYTSTGRIELRDKKRECYIWCTDLITEPLGIAWLDTADSMVYAQGISGTTYKLSVASILDTYDAKDPIKQYERYRERGDQILEHLTQELKINGRKKGY